MYLGVLCFGLLLSVWAFFESQNVGLSSASVGLRLISLTFLGWIQFSSVHVVRFIGPRLDQARLVWILTLFHWTQIRFYPITRLNFNPNIYCFKLFVFRPVHFIFSASAYLVSASSGVFRPVQCCSAQF
jgi:hypothetical protein